MTFERYGLRIGHLFVDAVTFADALRRIEDLIASGAGGAVFTPNVDHVVNADRFPALREAYAAASLSLADGMPLVWVSRLLRLPLPERVAGSDVVPALLEAAATRGYRVFLLGGAPGVAEQAASLLRQRGVAVVGHEAPAISLAPSADEAAIVERVAAARPDLVLVALGSPKQELFIHRASAAIRPAVALGIGASLDFLTGRARRAPAWMRRLGLEWLYRLAQEPRRLAQRYLINDPKFLLILMRMLRSPKRGRVAHDREAA